MERVFLNINQTNRELNHKIRQYLKQQTVRGQVRDLRVLARALTDVTLLVPVLVDTKMRHTSVSGYSYVVGEPDVHSKLSYTIRDERTYLVTYTDLAKSRAGQREPDTMQVQMPYLLNRLATDERIDGIILNPGTDDVTLPKSLLLDELDGRDIGAVTGTVADDLPIQAPEQVAAPVGVVAIDLRLNELNRLRENLETMRTKNDRRIDRYARQTWNFVAVITLVILALMAVPVLGRRGLLPTAILILLAIIIGRIIPVSATNRQRAKVRVYEKERALVRMIAVEDDIYRMSFDEKASDDKLGEVGDDNADLFYVNQDVLNEELIQGLNQLTYVTKPADRMRIIETLSPLFETALYVQPIFTTDHQVARDIVGRPYLADDNTRVSETIPYKGQEYLHIYLRTRDAIKDQHPLLMIKRLDYINNMFSQFSDLKGIVFDMSINRIAVKRTEFDKLYLETEYLRKVPTNYLMVDEEPVAQKLVNKKPQVTTPRDKRPAATIRNQPMKPVKKPKRIAGLAKVNVDWFGYSLLMLVAFAIDAWLMYANAYHPGQQLSYYLLGAAGFYGLYAIDINNYRKKHLFKNAPRVNIHMPAWQWLLFIALAVNYYVPINYMISPNKIGLETYMYEMVAVAVMAFVLIIIGTFHVQKYNKY